MVINTNQTSHYSLSSSCWRWVLIKSIILWCQRETAPDLWSNCTAAQQDADRGGSRGVFVCQMCRLCASSAVWHISLKLCMGCGLTPKWHSEFIYQPTFSKCHCLLRYINRIEPLNLLTFLIFYFCIFWSWNTMLL